MHAALNQRRSKSPVKEDNLVVISDEEETTTMMSKQRWKAGILTLCIFFKIILNLYSLGNKLVRIRLDRQYFVPSGPELHVKSLYFWSEKSQDWETKKEKVLMTWICQTLFLLRSFFFWKLDTHFGKQGWFWTIAAGKKNVNPGW